MKSTTHFTLFIFCLLLNINAVFCQDVITLRNGEDVIGKVREVGASEIKYNKLDNLTGPVYVLNKAEVFMVKYENGTKDVFGNTGNSTSSGIKTTEQKSVVVEQNNITSAPPINTKINEDEYNHYLRLSKSRLKKGIICTSIGVPSTAAGIALTAIGFNALIMDEGFDPFTPGSSAGIAFLVLGPVLTCVGIPLTIVGAVNLGKSAHYSRLAKAKKASLSFEPMLMPNTFGNIPATGYNGGFRVKISF